jgi:hypothetical protein
MVRLRAFLTEWKARRAGRKFVSHDIRRSARDIVGPTGDVFSNAWEHLEQQGGTYLESFDRRIPPSLHVSERDRTRWNIPIPLVERCIEDWEPSEAAAPDEEPTPAE